MTTTPAPRAAARPEVPRSITLVQLDEVASTNDAAKSRAGAGAEAGTLILADRQTRGRGRGGRSWTSPSGNLYASLILRPRLPPGRAAELSFVASLVVRETVARFVDADIRLKWPNDVLADGAKISGILLETSSTGHGAVDWVVVGVGLNVASYPEAAAQPATSLAALGGPGELAPVVEAFAAAWPRLLGAWRDHGFPYIRECWLAHAQGLGRTIEARLPGATVVGRFETIDETGALIVRTAEGTRRAIASADVFPRESD